MRFCVFILLLLLCFSYLPALTAKPKYIFKIDNKLQSIESNNQCKSLRVIDARKNRDNIGFLREGQFDGSIPVITEQPFDTFLQNIYGKMKVDAKSTSDELIMVLYEFEMYDKPAQIGTLCIRADLFRGNDGKYKLVAIMDSLYELRSSRTVTDDLLASVKQKIPSLLTYYACKLTEVNTKLYSLEELSNKRDNEKLSYPIYNTTQYKKGVYYTCDQFLNNMPIDTPLIKWSYLKGDNRVTQFYYQDGNGKRSEGLKNSDFFAIYDGASWWLGDSLTIREIKYMDGDFYATKHIRQAFTGGFGNIYFPMGPVVVMIKDVGADKVRVNSALYNCIFNPGTKQFVPVSRPK